MPEEEELLVVRYEQADAIGNQGADCHRIEKTGKVNEAAVSEDAAVGVEDAESDSIGNEQKEQLLEEAPEVVDNGISAADEIEREDAAAYNDGKVDNENAPIRQCITTKIPIDDL